MIRSKRLSKLIKIRLHETIIQPSVVAETKCLTREDKGKLRIFEKRMISKMNIWTKQDLGRNLQKTNKPGGK